MSQWRDKVVLVTGGSSGLGLAIARAFAAGGAKTVIVARDAEKLSAAAERLRSLGGEVLELAGDVTQQHDVDTIVARTIERFGRLDVLVNNAGRSDRGEAIQATPEAFRELLELNFISVVRCTRAAADHLLASRGHVVNIGSLAAKSASRYVGAYPASKFAVAAYSQQLRLELGPRGLHVLLVCPGPIARDEQSGESRRDYGARLAGLPDSAREPGAGVKVSQIDPDRLAQKILTACRRRRPELVVPGRARLLFAVSQLCPRLGDWIVRRMT